MLLDQSRIAKRFIYARTDRAAARDTGYETQPKDVFEQRDTKPNKGEESGRDTPLINNGLIWFWMCQWIYLCDGLKGASCVGQCWCQFEVSLLGNK